MDLNGSTSNNIIKHQEQDYPDHTGDYSTSPLRVGRISRDNTTTWWHHQMESFSALLALCAGNSPVSGEFPAQRPVTRSFDVFFDQRLNKRLNKQSWGWWFETPSRSLWRHHNRCFQWGWPYMVENMLPHIIMLVSRCYDGRLQSYKSIFDTRL